MRSLFSNLESCVPSTAKQLASESSNKLGSPVSTLLKSGVVLFLIGIFLSSLALACPEIEKIPDFNCDRDLQIVVIGDSLVYGFGDTKYKNKGGYVLRTQRKLKKAAVSNVGRLGLRSEGLLQLLVETFDENLFPQLLSTLRAADVVVIDVGRNDRWLFGQPKDTFSNLVKAAQEIRSEVRALEGIEPIVVTAVMMLPNRGSQGPWMKELNSLILKSNSTRKPADLRFDLVSKRLLGFDQVHPTSAGYDVLSRTLISYLKGSLAKKMRVLRPDSDSDGLPDLLEKRKFLTDPSIADSDGDGKGDGEEVLTLGTNPLGQ